jgi:hypothetical protein
MLRCPASARYSSAEAKRPANGIGAAVEFVAEGF